MIIRKIKPNELKRFLEMCSICFEYPYDSAETAAEVAKRIKTKPATREDVGWKEHYLALEDDDKTIMSGFAAIPYPFNFDGHECDMRGIGGVVTLPPYRKNGGIRACFEKALPEMYETGAVFSYLYPFSTSFYRKFGYEMGCEKARYKVLLDQIPKFPVSGTTVLVEPHNSASLKKDIISVYRVWQERYNMMICGGDIEFAWIDKLNPAKDMRFTYLYKDANGVPKAYMIVEKLDESDGRNLLCRRFFFTDTEGFYGLLQLLKTFNTSHRYVSLEVPRYPNLVPLISEWSLGAASSCSEYAGMIRVVNAEKALTLARYRGSGSVTLSITDAQIAQNTDTFTVEFADGVAKTVKRTTLSPDASMTIQEFARLITGVCDTELIPWIPDVTIHTSLDKLAPVFYRKPVMITEYF